MGVKFVIGNVDSFQLQEINVKSMWLSIHFLFQYDFALLEHYVRSRSDPKLQEILATLRKIHFNDQDIDKATALICDNCHFISICDKAPINAIMIVPKRRASSEVTGDYLKVRAQTTISRTFEDHATDQ